MKKILIVAGGERPSDKLIKNKATTAQYIIAADRGAAWCIDAGIRPDLVVGDFDSLDGAVLESIVSMGIEIKKYNSDKAFTDTQIALDIAFEKGAEGIDIVSGIGSRFDHSLANVHLLYRALMKGANARLITDIHEIFLIDKKCIIKGEKSTLVSFLPLSLSVEKISLKGFEYEIDKTDMNMDFPFGISNIIVADNASVEVGAGILIGILTRRPE